MWKQLFAEAPANAAQNLLTPRRKIMYATIAFAPGTILGLYLNSVKHRMDEENELLRLHHVQEELAVEAERQKKDVVLIQMMEDLRNRIKRLEEEAQIKSPASTAAAKPATPEKTVEPTPLSASTPVAPASDDKPLLPSFLAEYEDTAQTWKTRFEDVKARLEQLQEQFNGKTESRKQEDEETQKKREILDALAKERTGPSGISERVRERERGMLADDVRSYKGASK
ncbi:hypothetical protein Poli38472_008666 [Pythium oligandrum]|uniref:Uncharacterized protein n=1 Tax=Pythium oligandrum TaxID=41045 RepID=A0A8K1C462_PYTOL|nr:hypothetical protein Poli38472_008666 [Pythium oligandrum]|eukprot:TMW56018.1 hypothetical protein Poli38472_008666 [Pythium oligandrum]